VRGIDVELALPHQNSGRALTIEFAIGWSTRLVETDRSSRSLEIAPIRIEPGGDRLRADVVADEAGPDRQGRETEQPTCAQIGARAERRDPID